MTARAGLAGGGAQTVTTAILNGFGRTLGDHLIGIQALHAALELGAVSDPVAYGLPNLGPIIADLRTAAADFCPTRELPWSHATRDTDFPVPAARTIDCRDLAFDPAYLAHHDLGRYFLERLGLDPATVPAPLRRITWLSPRLSFTRRTGNDILICPRAAMPLRSMPDAFHTLACRVAARLAPILTQATLPPAPDLASLCALVAGARLVLSTDTAMVHLADALDVPCLAFFPTHDPSLRVAHYPKCLPVRLPTSLPDNLEFPRDPADITAAHAAWPLDARWLTTLIERALAQTSPASPTEVSHN